MYGIEAASIELWIAPDFYSEHAHAYADISNCHCRSRLASKSSWLVLGIKRAVCPHIRTSPRPYIPVLGWILGDHH